MTNGDWVRSLDDDAYCEKEKCGAQWQKWVKQEHKENSNEL